MKCPKCHFDNRKGAKFCLTCGEALRLNCPQCGKELPLLAEFCDECGHDVRKRGEPKETVPEAEGERKYVTVLFSDLSGYTAMSEKLDPEEVKDITTQIFGEVSKVIEKYDGFVEKFVGDAVMALFGVPKAHEDDPVRAIRAAREVHDIVQNLSPEIEKKIGKPLSMHSGINTGLVVTGEVNMEKGTHGVAGDTINVASRLSGLANADEIIVGHDTWLQTEGYCSFEALEPTTVKGKADPVQVYKFLSLKERPEMLHRLSGVRADLVGRNAEMANLKEAVDNLREGKGKIYSISGDAGTGKSRLLREFKASLDLEGIQWFEGHAYAYAQNIPYFPLIDMLNRVFQVDESDPPETLQGKLESGITELVGNEQDVIPYVGSLYALTYTELVDVNPELWKSRLKSAVKSILTALAKKGPTIFCLEDLHWADPSSVEILRYLLLEMREPALVLCVYRPPFSLFTSYQLQGMDKIYQEMQLTDLSPSDAQHMLALLLKTEHIPSDLERFVQDKAEGNPFYLEELINSLIESGTLIRDDGDWRLTKSIQESDISSSIHGVIAGRLDRLETETKRVLQEASVIGRAFLYDILKTVTELKEQCDKCLSGLERMDLIKTRSLDPELEYIFKHALTQEVVYNGLLKKEREEIHERIAQVIEDLFSDRLPEFYETLAFHFRRSPSKAKAIEYLVKAGKKSLARYSVEEAHQYFEDAYEILQAKAGKSKDENLALIDLLNEWGYSYYYLGEIKIWIDLFTTHQELAESLDDPARLGMFYAWMGIAYYMRGKPKIGYDYLIQAKNLGEKAGDQKVIGYACAWLVYSCLDLGLFPEGIAFGERALKIAESFPSDQYLFFKPLSGLGLVYANKGDIEKALDAGRRLLEYGERHANSRSKVFGHFVNSYAHNTSGDFSSAMRSGEKAVEVAEDPFYLQIGRNTAGLAAVGLGKYQETEQLLTPCVEWAEKTGADGLLLMAYIALGPALIVHGRMKQGMDLMEKARQMLHENERKTTEVFCEYVMGCTYAFMATGPKPGLGVMARNIGFIIKNVPAASKKALEHLNRTIELSKEIGSKGFFGSAYLHLGLFYKSKRQSSKARETLSEAARIFKEIGAETYLKNAEEALASLG